MRLLNILTLLFLLNSIALARIWTDNKERKIDAEMLESNETQVLFKLKDGRKTWFDIAKLMQKDQAYIKSQEQVTKDRLEAQKKAALTMKILFIGNSYTGGVRKAVIEIVAASPYAKSELKFINPGGRNLLQHSENKGVLDTLKSKKWDVVVLQDQSQTPAVANDRFRQGLKKLDDIIDGIGAQTMLFMTWGYRDGDLKHNPQRFPTYKPMQDELTKAYEGGAEMANAKIVPVGEAWRSVRSSNKALGIELYRGDGSHPSKKGAYLAANVFYMTLFGADPTKLDFTFGLPADECKVMQMAAAKAAKMYNK